MAKYDFEEMKAKMGPFTANQDAFCDAVNEAYNSVEANVASGNGALDCAVGNQLRSEWENNCAPILQFRGYFDNLITKSTEIYNSKVETSDTVVSDLTSDHTEVPAGPDFYGKNGTGIPQEIAFDMPKKNDTGVGGR